ncbi:MAG: hypothetical protein ABJM43_02140 [Paracoccaceae bacterium]
MFTPYSEKSDEERAAITKRSQDREAGIAAAADYVRSHQNIRDIAIELSVRSAPVTNENWTTKLSQEWQGFSLSVIKSYTNGLCNPAFLQGTRTNEELESFFAYGLQFVVRELRNGEFEFGDKIR